MRYKRVRGLLAMACSRGSRREEFNVMNAGLWFGVHSRITLSSGVQLRRLQAMLAEKRRHRGRRQQSKPLLSEPLAAFM